MFLLIALTALIGLTQASVNLIIENKCSFDIWPGLQGNPRPTPSGFKLSPGTSRTFPVADGIIAARVWARTGCKGTEGSTFKCETGDCGNTVNCLGRGGEKPMSLAEFTFDNKFDNNKGLDFYDVSYIEGYNVPILMTPKSGTFVKRSGDKYDCASIGKCSKDLKSSVAAEMQIKVNGKLVGSHSACTKTNDDKFCCRNAHDKPETCPISVFPAKYYSDLKKICPTAYFYAYDDKTSTYTCKGASGRKSAEYYITFCG